MSCVELRNLFLEKNKKIPYNHLEDYDYVKLLYENAKIKKYSEKKTQKPYIVKMLFTTGSSEKERQEAENEVEVLKSISHESIVNYVEYFFENKKYFLIMEFCSGGDLKKAIDGQKRLGKTFSEEIVLNYVVTNSYKQSRRP